MHIIFVHKILNSRSYSGHAKAHLQISKIILTIILENPKIRVFPKILRKVKHFKICDLQTC